MLRQASSRNHRSKGFKLKHALQICLLIAICIWLLYQVKHSHEKKKAFEERNSKNLNKVVENPEDFFKLGRKDLPLIDETVFENETHNKEDEKEDENEDAQEEEPATNQQEEIEDDEGRGDGDDDIDEQDQEKGDEEAENGEESTEKEDKDNHDEVDLFDNQEHEGGSQEAREENYKRDDASSAVVHDTLVTESENSNGDERSMEEQVVDKADDESNDNGSKQLDDSSTIDSKSDEDSNGDGSNHDVNPIVNGSKSDADTNIDSFKGEAVTENLEKKIVGSENVTNGTDDGSRGATVLKDNETLSTDNLPSNVMADNKNIEADNKDLEIEFSKPDNGSVANSTIVEDNNQMEQKDNSSTVNADDIAVSNNTINSDLGQDQNIKGDGTTLGEDEHNNLRNVESEEYSTISSSSTNENGDAAHEESENLSQAVITEEEKIDRTDLSTLPDIQSELKSTDDEAAE